MQEEFLVMQREQYDEHEGPGMDPDPERVWNGDEFAFGRSEPLASGALLFVAVRVHAPFAPSLTAFFNGR